MSKRLTYIDVARAIAIVCVVAGHTFSPYGLIHDFCFTFELPLFLFTSGFLTNPDRRLTKDYVLKSLRALMLPYAVTCLIIIALTGLRGAVLESQSALANMTPWALAAVYGSGNEVPVWPNAANTVFPPIGAIWFLPALFFTRMFLLGLNGVHKEWQRSLCVLALLAFGCASAPYFWLPMSLQAAMACLPFAYAGQLVRKHGILEKGRLHPAVWAAGFVLFAACVWLGGHTYLNRAAYEDGYLVGLLGGIVGSLCILKLSQWFCSQQSLMTDPLAFVGQSTLAVLCMHLVEMVAGPQTIPSIALVWPQSNTLVFLLRLGEIAALCACLWAIPPLRWVYFPSAEQHAYRPAAAWRQLFASALAAPSEQPGEQAAQKAPRGLAWVAAILAGIISATALYLVVFVNQHAEDIITSHNSIPNPTLLVVALALLLALAYAIRRAPRHHTANTTKRFLITLLILSAVFALGQTVMVVALLHFSPWDPEVLLAYVTGDTSRTAVSFTGEYFSRFPNNATIIYIFSAIAAVAQVFGVSAPLALPLVGAYLINIGSALTAVAARRATGSDGVGYAAFAIVTLLATFSPWISVAYTDQYLYPQVSASVCLAVYALHPEAQHRTLCFAGAEVFAILGALVKPTSLIIAAMLVLTAFVRAVMRVDKARVLAGTVLSVAVAAAFAVGVVLPAARAAYHPDGVHFFAPNEEAAFSWRHFMLMGFNPQTNGVYAEEDYQYTLSFQNKEERDAADLRLIAERWNAMSPAERHQFFTKKLMIDMCDGSFSFGDGAYDPAYATLRKGMHPVTDFVQDLFMPQNRDDSPMRNVEQTVWLLVLVLLPITTLAAPRKGASSWTWLYLTACYLLVVAYVLLFEARTRYLFAYLPVLATLAAVGLAMLGGVGAGGTQDSAAGKKARHFARLE